MSAKMTSLTLLGCLLANAAFAHGEVGERVFPVTLTFDDPGVADEITLPQVSVTRDADGGWGSDTTAEYSKLLTDTLAVSVGGGYASSRDGKGFDNIELGLKKVFYTNAPHELMLSAGLEQEFGHSGARSVAEGFNTTTPALFFGKGMGDLPASLSALRPLALTGTVGWSLPSQRRTTDAIGAVTTNPQTLQWAASLQYSLPYLQHHTKGAAVSPLFANFIPVVEFALDTPTSGPARQTTGSINPGVIYLDDTMQVGLEAVMPLNKASGNSVGAVTQLHFFLDDIFPDTIGKPIW